MIARSVPILEAVAAPGEPEEAAPTAVRVLLVDDEEMVLRVTKAHLERRGHQAFSNDAAHGATGVDDVRKDREQRLDALG